MTDETEVMNTDVYVMVGEDRHFDVQVEVFTDELSAVRAAAQFIEDHASGNEHEADPEDSELNEAMIADGWVFSEVYSVEGDSVRVVRRRLHKAETENE